MFSFLKPDLSLLLLSVNGASHSLNYASWKPKSLAFPYLLLPTFNPSPSFDVFPLNITQICPLLFYSHSHRDHRSSGFDSSWSTHIQFGLLLSISHRTAKEIIQNAKVSNAISAALNINVALAYLYQPSFDLYSLSFSPFSPQPSFKLSYPHTLPPLTTPITGTFSSSLEIFTLLLGVHSDSCFRSWLSLPQHHKKYLLNNLWVWRGGS